MANNKRFKIDKASAIRTIILIIALINQALVAFGLSPFPFSANEIEVALSYVFTVAATLWAWYRNNSITPEAQEADEYMRKLKRKNGDNYDG